MTRHPASARGFTLVELLVALSLFALMALAGVALLRSSVDTQSGIAERLDEGGALERVRALLTSELAAAQPRAGRDASGTPRAAFAGDAATLRFSFAQSGGGAGGSGEGVTTVVYTVASDTLIRSAAALPDGGTGDPATILRDISGARWRFRQADGTWAAAFANSAAAFADAATPGALPRAVELTFSRGGSAPLTLRFLVGPGDLPGDLPVISPAPTTS